MSSAINLVTYLSDEPHRKNGCTPLHLAHFCTIDDTNPDRTIRELTAAGADINNPGSRKCGKFPIEHAIQHQRLNSVQVLLSLGSQVHNPNPSRSCSVFEAGQTKTAVYVDRI